MHPRLIDSQRKRNRKFCTYPYITEGASISADGIAFAFDIRYRQLWRLDRANTTQAAQFIAHNLIF